MSCVSDVGDLICSGETSTLSLVTGPLLVKASSASASLSNFNVQPPLISKNQLILSVYAPSLSQKPLKALLDSGCTRSFIDRGLVRRTKAKTTPLPHPLSLKLFDGSNARDGRLRDYTKLEFTVTDMRDPVSETFDFLITDLDPSISMALGYDWLAERNPQIDWKNGAISMNPPDSVSETLHGRSACQGRMQDLSITWDGPGDPPVVAQERRVAE